MKLKGANRRTLGAVAVTGALLVPLGVFGAPALARSASAASEYEYSGSSQYQYKITICHKTHSHKHGQRTIRVSVNAWKGHQRHGDTMGACQPLTAPTSSPKHGKSGEHGSSDAQHGQSGESHGKGH